MPAPKNLERIESPGNNTPPPSERMERNNGAATNLTKAKKPSFRETLENEGERAKKEKEERILRVDQAGQSVLDEGNRGEEAWHRAMRERGNEDMQRRRNGWETDIDKLRRGEVNGQPRENSPEDLRDAAQIRWIADEIRLERASQEDKNKHTTPEPTPTQASTPTPKGTSMKGDSFWMFYLNSEVQPPVEEELKKEPEPNTPLEAPIKPKSHDRLADLPNSLNA